MKPGDFFLFFCDLSTLTHMHVIVAVLHCSVVNKIGHCRYVRPFSGLCNDTDGTRFKIFIK